MHISKQKPACVVQCAGQSIKADWVDTNPATTYDHTPTDRADILAAPDDTPQGAAGAENMHLDYAGTGTPAFAAPGSDQGLENRGTKYVADANLTRPALKIRNRVYVNRDGGGVS